MKIELEFTDVDCDLRLVRIAFWANTPHKENDPKRQVFAAVEAAPGSEKEVFRWTATVRAFCVLMLRASIRADPVQASLRGGKGSAARSLGELVGEKTAPPDDPNWIQFLFLPLLPWHSAFRRLPADLFKSTSNSKENIFTVKLGGRWKGAEIVILRGESNVTEIEAAQMADSLDPAQKTRSRKPYQSRLSAAVELFAWDSERAQLLPIDNCLSPLSVHSGVSLRIRLTRAACPYLVWITGRGLVQPLYPWQNFNWQQRGEVAPVTDLHLPVATDPKKIKFYPIDSRPGVETALVFASETPFPVTFERTLCGISKHIGAFYPTRLPDPKVVYYLGDPRPENLKESVVRLGEPRLLDNPLAQFLDKLIQYVGFSCPCVAGVSFSTRR